ncbi:M48 family metallopeptidase [Acinetobacter sp. ANC 4648]|uniref:M48 family metallopeptidase n=1 Tax=Acinetobacter sp. ANC 4648 TaxID=1977875 RepID=UPI000A355CE6|nr:M48 family metallopeptidase [Acinetobacter sp. ANC 4648]OTG79811.1 peptidase [Acinetobacter sp. ANC 4648]
MQSVSVIFYDGVLSKAYQAELMAVDQYSVIVRYHDLVNNGRQSQLFKIEHMTLIGALGKKHPVIELDNDARIELLSNEIPEWLPLKHKNFQQKIGVLERTPALIVFSVIFIIALGFSVLKWGIPWAAKIVAFQLPENTLHQLGDQAEVYVMDWTKPTQLAAGQRQQIKTQYLNKIAQGHPANLIFRNGQRLGANALALPNNTIIVTDELVELAHSDQEILAVLAHEQGHLIQRHSLQQGLSNLGFSVLYIAITGDSSDVLTTIPVALLGASYSRQFEQDADLYALELMQQQKIEVSHFANFLQRLNDGTAEMHKEHQQESKNKDSETLTILSSHPATEERIKMVRAFETQHPFVTHRQPAQ